MSSIVDLGANSPMSNRLPPAEPTKVKPSASALFQKPKITHYCGPEPLMCLQDTRCNQVVNIELIEKKPVNFR